MLGRGGKTVGCIAWLAEMAMAGKPGEQQRKSGELPASFIYSPGNGGRGTSKDKAVRYTKAQKQRGWPKWPWLESLVSSCCC
jgi:hypothetical protein